VTDTFADLLYRHISSELPEGYLKQTHRISSGRELQSRLFTEKETFRELVRASEGVARDLINIFTKAYFFAQRRDRISIDRKSITEAARQWFEQDQSKNLGEDLRTVLRRIVDDVIGTKQARSFLLPRNLEASSGRPEAVRPPRAPPCATRLRRQNHPGERCGIYSLDYGTYVDLLGASKQPEIELKELQEGANGDDVVVPFDDKRSIRRIILQEDVLRV
jgi:hypothetical protein